MHSVYVGLGEDVLGTALAVLIGGTPNKRTSDSKLKSLHKLCMTWCRSRKIANTAEQFSLRQLWGDPKEIAL
jgi:hypothetical protein